MNANALDDRFPHDLTKRILSQGSPRLWMANYLRRVGTKEDLDQLVWEVCLDPKHAERVAKKQWLSLGGYVAVRMRREVTNLNHDIPMGESMEWSDGGLTIGQDNLPQSQPQKVRDRLGEETPPEDLFEDPWETYLDPEVRQLVKDRFYAGDDRAKQEALLEKYGLSSTSALRMRALRAVNAAKRKHNSLDS